MLRVLLLILPLAACGNPYGPPPQWARPNATSVELDRDYATCDYEATVATAAIPNPYEAAARHIMVRNSCMMAKGWQDMAAN